MNDGSAFLRALQEKPDDEATRLVYADWLEEQSDPGSRARAAFLRAEHELSGLPQRDPRRQDLKAVLRGLAAETHLAWRVVVSKAPSEGCEERFACPGRWDRLTP